MLLTVDLGNTSIKLGIFDKSKQVAFSCFDGPQADYKSLFLSFLFKAGLRLDQIDKAIYSCVVPKLYDTVFDVMASIVGSENIVDINPKKNYGIKLAMPNPDEVGDDLIVMCSFAYNLCHKELLVVSMGTCSVICHVTKTGEFKHCIIAPGFSKIAETLWNNAAQLPQFQIKHSNTFLANNTIDAMNVGIYNGYIGMLSSLIKGLKKELNEEMVVIGCGGQGKLIAEHIPDLDVYDPDFVTKGLNYIYEKYSND